MAYFDSVKGRMNQFHADDDFHKPHPTPYVYQEYPRLLYRGDEQKLVHSDEEKAAHLEQGWTILKGAPIGSDAPNDDFAPAKRGPGRPKKVVDE